MFGLAILGFAFISALAVSFRVKQAVHSQLAAPLAPPRTEGLPGFPTQFDPLAALEQAREVSIRKGLFGIVLKGVASNGTVDLSGQQNGALVRFVLGSRRGEGPQPPVPPGERRLRDYCGRQEVQVDASGMRAQPDQAAHKCRGFSEELAVPHCGPKQLWQRALGQGAPRDARADIEYYQAAAGPAWRFSIPKSPFQFVLYGDCGRELSEDEAKGHVP